MSNAFTDLMVARKIEKVKGEMAISYASVASPAGVDPTGVTEATSAINTSLTANTGKTVFIPRGLYLVDTISVPAGTTLLLDDRATFKLKAGAARPAVSLNGTGATLRGGVMDGNGTNQTVSEGASLVRISADDCTVEAVTLINIKDYGIRSSMSRSRIRNNTILGGGGNAIFIQPAAVNIVDPIISGNHVDRSDQGTGIQEGGIKVHRNGALTTTGARIANNRVILPIGTTLAPPVCIEVFQNCDNASITGNTVKGGRIGISIANAKGAAITGNTCTQNGDYGIEFSGAIRSTASGNTVDGGGTGSTGISCNSAATNCAINGNTVSGCTGSSIKIEGVCVNISISGNVVNATAVYAVEAISSTHLVISGNLLDGNATALKAVMLDKTFPATVSGNVARRFTQNAVLVASTTAQTVNLITVVGNTFDSTNGAIATQLSGGATLGSGIRATGNMPFTDILNVSGDVRQISGTGTPEGFFGGGPGSIFLRTDTGTMYVKNSGTGTAGWKLVTQAA